MPKPFDPVALMEALSRPEGAADDYQNLGLAGSDYSVLPSLIGISLFAWACNRGPFLGGVPHIDNLHYQQGLVLVGNSDSPPSKSVPLDITSHGSQQGGLLIVGTYNFFDKAYNWVSVLNAPNTGVGAPRGTLSYDRSLKQNPTTDGKAGWRFLGPGGQLWFDLFYWEDDSSTNGIFFQFVGISSTTGGPQPTSNAVQLP